MHREKICPCGRYCDTRLSAPLDRNNSPKTGQFAWLRKDLKSTFKEAFIFPRAPANRAVVVGCSGQPLPAGIHSSVWCQIPKSTSRGPYPDVSGLVGHHPLRFMSSISPSPSASIPHSLLLVLPLRLKTRGPYVIKQILQIKKRRF